MTSDGARHPTPEEATDLFRRADAVFDAVLDLEGAERRAYIERACAGDDALRDAVQRLLRAHERAGDFLDSPAVDVARPLLDTPARDARIADDVALRERLARALGAAYRLEGCIGRGGMAIVYRAEDLRHERPVAVKVLDPELGASMDRERAARFLAEIRVTARLQHPNVVPVFDSGAAEGLLYFVMPYVEGETLRRRLRRESPLPVEEALRIALGIGRALEHAHAHGIVHRDLKPENVLLQGGEPVVADFGIALAVSHVGDARITSPGLTLGTPQYMSPEQASADGPVDVRTDVYALGAVLYEMLTGDPPHAASSAHAVLAKRRAEPATAVRVVRPTVPEHVASAVERALARDPGARFGSVREMLDALTEARAIPAPDARGARWGPGARTAALAAVGVLGAVAAVVVLRQSRAERTTPAARPSTFVVTPPPGANLRAPALAPDGTRLVYVGTEATQRRLLVRSLSELAATPLAGTEGATRAIFSPDGRSIAFFTTEDKLKRIASDGGPVTVLAPAFRFGTGSWTGGDRIVFTRPDVPGLVWMPAAGGTSRPLTRVDSARKETRHVAPLAIDGGRRVFFTVERGRGGPAAADGDLAVTTLDPSAESPAVHSLVGVRVQSALTVIKRWLLFVAPGGVVIRAVRLDPTLRRAVGEPITLLEAQDGGIEGPQLARDGTLLYMRSIPRNQPVLVDTTGAPRPVAGAPTGSYMNPRLSPDGRRLVIQSTQSARATDAWIIDLAARTSTQLTHVGNAINPTWTTDGAHVVYVSESSGRSSLRAQRADGSEPSRRIADGPGVFAPDVTTDGRTIVFQRDTAGVIGIWSAPLGGGESRPVLMEPFNLYMPTVSPDGRWLAYVAKTSGRYAVWVRPFPGPGTPTRISENGTEPAWSRDGRRIFYRANRSMVAATLRYEPTIAVASRTTLFAGRFDDDEMPMPHRNFDVTADGRQFVMIASSPETVRETVVSLGWLDEVRARLARLER
ncbi:MAG TPA: protein kinase [Gemmatimonadaceae bacterium]|nr:protein kinase [Gemmatimonadaceae bacterium]